MPLLYRKPKLFSRHKKKKNIIKQEMLRAPTPIALDVGRDRHKNMDITPLRKTTRIDPNKPLREPVDNGPQPLEIDQNYDVIKKTVIIRASGKKIIKYVKNNPPGKRYQQLSESKIAKGEIVGEYTEVTGTTLSEYNEKIRRQKKEAQEEAWRQLRSKRNGE